jgi:hypothetical protein
MKSRGESHKGKGVRTAYKVGFGKTNGGRFQ